MRLGFYTDYSIEIARFAQEVGFKSLQLSAWPQSALDVNTVSDECVYDIQMDLASKDIEISALGYYPNFLDPDPIQAEEARNYFLKVLERAAHMGVPVVSTFAGRRPELSVRENIPLFERVFSRFCEKAEQLGIKIAIENCPMLDRFYLRGENIAFSPEIWDEMYRVVPSKALGIELDPSHMVWQGIDYIQAIYDYGDRIYHIHAKDMEINHKVMRRVGILGQCFGEVYGLGHGWWRARTPGWGEIDWPKLISALLEVNYPGNLDIEHEDDVFALANALKNPEGEADIVGMYGREQKGLVLGYNTLSPLIPT
jgi:sugar phosphate isomerase/epimerase